MTETKQKKELWQSAANHEAFRVNNIPLKYEKKHKKMKEIIIFLPEWILDRISEKGKISGKSRSEIIQKMVLEKLEEQPHDHKNEAT